MNKSLDQIRPDGRATDGQVITLVTRAAVRGMSDLLVERVKFLQFFVEHQQQLLSGYRDCADLEEVVANNNLILVLLTLTADDLKR